MGKPNLQLREEVLRRLEAGPISHDRCGRIVHVLRALKADGVVEHEYDDRSDLVWRLRHHKPVEA